MDNPIDLHPLLKWLAECGFTYIRVKPNDKRPDGKWSKFEDRITADQVMSRIEQGGNYGIVPPEGCFILDFDSDEAYQRSVANEPSIGESLTFKTPRGFHVVFQGEDIPQGASHTFLGQGVDVRAGDKGYVVGPGSVREDGRYEHHSGNAISAVSDSLRKLLQKPSPIPSSMIREKGKGSPVSSPQSPVAASSDMPEGKRSLSVIERGKAAKKHWKVLDDAQPTFRNNSISSAATGLGSLYADAEPEKRDQIFAKLIGHADRLADNDAEIQEFRTTATNQWNKGAESPATRPDESEGREVYRIVFRKYDIHECEISFADMKFSVRNNQETDKVEYLISDDGSFPGSLGFRFKVGEWFIADKKTDNAIIGNITRHYGRQKGNSIVSVSLPETKFKVWRDTLAAENPIRPFHGWIETRSPNPAFEDLTLDNWLHPWQVDCESELNRWISRAIMIGIVQKAYKDKQAYRIIPVLRGEQAIGKTTLVRELIPEPFRCMFGQFTVNSKKADMVGAIKGKFLCEAGELAGMNDSRVSIFKAFIGNQSNTSRLPYEAEFQDYENTAFIVGTSNPDRNVPNDDALRSRLVFMDLKRGENPETYIPERLSHLYALAREAYLGGERVGVLPEHLVAEQWEASEDSMIINPIMHVKLHTNDWRLYTPWFTSIDVMQGCGLISRFTTKAPPGAQKAVRDYLEELGVGTTRKDMKKKGPARLWHYHESDEIRRIRAEQIKAGGKKTPIYGFESESSPRDLSELD